MSDNVTINHNTQEEVAYKLTLKIVGGGANSDEQKVLETYARCLKVVRGYEYADILAD